MQLLIQSSEDRESYPEEEYYPGYRRDMFFLKRLVKSIKQIAEEIKEEQLYTNLVVDFKSGTFKLEDFYHRSTIYLGEESRKIALIINLNYLRQLDDYFWYNDIKLRYDNNLRYFKDEKLIQEQRKRLTAQKK